MKKPAPVEPWKPVLSDEADIYAIRALAAGVANDGQQKRALNWIINIVCGTYDLSFRPGAEGDRDTVFAEGRRFVGLQLVKHINVNLNTK